MLDITLKVLKEYLGEPEKQSGDEFFGNVLIAMIQEEIT